MSEKNQTILIVDDEDELRNMLRFICEGMGYDVTDVDDGQKAFREASQGNFDLMLLDIMMPGWNGVEAVKSLDFINKRPKVIVISGFVTDELRQDLSEVENIIHFVQKPFKVDNIRKLITETINLE
jgi:CheY-like chemotaxis protein